MTTDTTTPHQQYPWYEDRTILRGLVGSTAHGLNVEADDRDEMGICIEPLHAMMGHEGEFEQVIKRTAADREGRHDAPSRAGDLDLTVYSLRKFTRLALQGNPTVLNLLFVPPALCTVRRAPVSQLLEMADAFVSKEAGYRYLGYMEAQRQRMTGERGGKGVRRPELVAKYGYDTKYAGHVVRLGFQGVQFLKTGRIELPMLEPERSWIRAVRVGKVSEQEVLTRAGELERQIKDLLTGPSDIPEKADAPRVWAWVRHTYLEWWKADAFNRNDVLAQAPIKTAHLERDLLAAIDALDGPRRKGPLDAEYETALAIINQQRAEIERLKDTSLRAEVVAALDATPGAIRVHEGGGAGENLAASLAVTLHALSRQAMSSARTSRAVITDPRCPGCGGPHLRCECCTTPGFDTEPSR